MDEKKPKGSAEFTEFRLEPRIINGEEVMVKVYDMPQAAKERKLIQARVDSIQKEFRPTGEQMKAWLGYTREDDK